MKQLILHVSWKLSNPVPQSAVKGKTSLMRDLLRYESYAVVSEATSPSIIKPAKRIYVGVLRHVVPISPPSIAATLEIDRDVVIPTLQPVISSLSIAEASERGEVQPFDVLVFPTLRQWLNRVRQSTSFRDISLALQQPLRPTDGLLDSV